MTVEVYPNTPAYGKEKKEPPDSTYSMGTTSPLEMEVPAAQQARKK